MLKIFIENTKVTENTIVTFGGTSPKYGWAVFLAGGPGSGKGFTRKTIMDIDATVFDVDAFKDQFIKIINKYPDSKLSRLKNKDDYDLSNPEDVTDLHMIGKTPRIGSQGQRLPGIAKANREYILQNIANGVYSGDRLPNIIFDTTGDEPSELSANANFVSKYGYKTSLVWVVTNREQAIVQNLMRARSVSDTILHSKHNTINDVLYKYITSKAGADFDECWIVFGSLDKAGNTAQERKWLTDNKTIKLTKQGSAFTLSKADTDRLFNTLGPAETNPDNPEVYLNQRDAKDKISTMGYKGAKAQPDFEFGKGAFRR